MFNSLVKNSVFYILDKNTKPVLKIGKVTNIVINPQYYGLANQELDITVSTDTENYEFKKLPGNVSIISPTNGIVISDNPEDMSKEYETLVNNSQNILDNIDYHKNVVESKDSIWPVLNPKFAKEREQELKFKALETKVSGMEQGIDDIKTMLTKVLTNK